jgi:hypothetical protein
MLPSWLATPVPLNWTCGETTALSLTVTVPVNAPAEVGVNATLIVQEDSAAKVRGAKGQSVFCEKSSEVEIPLISSGTV